MEHCDVCKAFERAPHVAIARAAAVSTFYDKSQVDLQFLDDLIDLHDLVTFPKYPLLLLVQPENPQEV